MEFMHEAHFCGLPSQGSIYGLTSLCTGQSAQKMLVASSKSKIYCIEYSKNQQNVLFSTREVHFTYIPGQAEIIAIDAFNQARRHAEDFVIGITFLKKDTNSERSQYFNIYSASNEFDLDNIAQGCLSIRLDFKPFHLTHAELYVNGEKETVWLLSDNNCKVHMYREHKDQQQYCKEPSEELFPEFAELKDVVLWMDFVTTETSRITAVGGRDGTIIVTSLNLVPEIQTLSSWSIEHEGPVSYVKLFHDSDFMVDGEPDHQFHLLVCNSLEVCVVYRDVLKHGLSLAMQKVLKDSSKYDAATCGLVADINMDGRNEILVGTYGQLLLCYKWVEDSEGDGEYVLFHKKEFSNPLLVLDYMDIEGDGMKELLILSVKGLHILQHDLKAVTDVCLQRMKKMLNDFSEEEISQMLFKDGKKQAQTCPNRI